MNQTWRRALSEPGRSPEQNKTRSRVFHTVSLSIAALSCALALLIVVDWANPQAGVLRFFPFFFSMSGYAGICTGIFGALLLLFIRAKPSSRWLALIPFGTAAVMAICSYNLYHIHLDPTTRTALTTLDPMKTQYTRNSFMAPVAAINFMFLAAGLFLAWFRPGPFRLFAQLSTLFATTLALFGLSGYLYLSRSASPVEGFLAMALPTAAVQITIAAALLIHILDHGPLHIIQRNSTGGRLIRWTIPLLLLIQITIELIRIQSLVPIGYEDSLLLKILFALNPVAVLLVILIAARTVDRSDEDRQQVVHALARLNGELEERVASRTEDLRRSNTSLFEEIRERKNLEREIAEVRGIIEERIGRTLHDGIAQDLLGLTFLLKEFQDEKRMPTATRRLLAAKIHSELLACCRSVRELAHQVYPHELTNGNIKMALEDLAAHIEDRERVRIPVSIVPDSPALPHETTTHLFFIVQEFIKNAIQHGKAREIRVALRSETGHGTLTLQDDGSGFDMGNHAEGIGLRIIRYRARAMGSALSLESAPGKGTRLRCTFNADRPQE